MEKFSTLYYLKATALLFAIAFFFTLNANAQTLVVTPTPATCLQNGELAWVVNGITDPATTLDYIVDDGDPATPPVGLTATQLTGLIPGTYTVTANLTVGGIVTTVLTETVTIADSYAPIQYTIDEAFLCDQNIAVNTTAGVLSSITVSAGPNLVGSTFASGNPAVLTGVIPGDYTLTVVDSCGSSETVVFTYIITPNSARITNEAVCGADLDCDSLRITNFFLGAQSYHFPAQVTTIVNTPSGSTLTYFTANQTSGTDIIIPYFDSDYSVTTIAIDACGDTTIANENINASTRVEQLEVNSCTNCFGLRVYNLKGDSVNINFTTVPASMTTAITPLNGNYSIDCVTLRNYTDLQLCDDNVTFDPGTYSLEIIDDCDTLTFDAVVLAADPFEITSTVNLYLCSADEAGLDIRVNNTIDSIFVTSAPATYTGPLDLTPFAQTSLSAVAIIPGIRTGLFEEGLYDISIIDICGVQIDTTIEVNVDLIPIDSATIVIQNDCNAFDMTFQSIDYDGGIFSTLYTLQWDSAGSWVDVDLVSFSGNGFDNVVSFDNILQTGNFRIVRRHSFSSYLPLSTGVCDDVIYEFTEDGNTLDYTALVGLQCTNDLSIIATATGLGTVFYDIISIDGVPQASNPTSSGLFNGLAPGVYIVEALDDCNSAIREIDIINLPPLTVSGDICDNEDGALFISGYSFLDYEWYLNADYTTVLSTNDSLIFMPYTSANNGTYSAVISFTNCIQDTIEYVLSNPISGCTDPSSSNFNPMATCEDGSCCVSLACQDTIPPTIMCPQDTIVCEGSPVIWNTTVMDDQSNFTNLLVNGDASLPGLTGWNIISTVGDGWNNYNDVGISQTFGTGNANCSDFMTVGNRRSQTIDLLALGYTPEFLDLEPCINFEETFVSISQNALCPDWPDGYYLLIELRDAAGNVIASYNSGSPTNAQFVLTSIIECGSFTNYGPGLRFIYFEDGGQDNGFWGGHYGTGMKNAVVSFGGLKRVDTNTNLLSGSVFPPGNTTISYIANDAACNVSDTCSFVVTVLANSYNDFSGAACTGDSVLLNGSYFGPGISTEVFPSANGCDSIITYTVNELLASSSQIDFVVCQGDSVNVNGTNYGLGTSSQTITNSAGCDSTLTIVIEDISVSASADVTICSGDSANISAQVIDNTSNQGSGYTIIEPGNCGIVNAGVADTLILGDDAGSAALPIGFAFEFFGNSYSDFYVSSNGYVTFDPTDVTDLSENPIPSSISPNAYISLFWDDLDPDNGNTGTIRWYSGNNSAGANCIVVEYIAVPHCCSSNNETVTGYIMFCDDNTVSVNCTECVPDNGNQNASFGAIENASGTIGYFPGNTNNGIYEVDDTLSNYCVTYEPIANCAFIGWVTDLNDIANTTVATTETATFAPLDTTTYYAVYDCNGIVCSSETTINVEQPAMPAMVNCWDNFQFDINICDWVNQGTQNPMPAMVDCWDNFQFDTLLCDWVNQGTQPTAPTDPDCSGTAVFNTVTCMWDETPDPNYVCDIAIVVCAGAFPQPFPNFADDLDGDGLVDDCTFTVCDGDDFQSRIQSNVPYTTSVNMLRTFPVGLLSGGTPLTPGPMNISFPVPPTGSATAGVFSPIITNPTNQTLCINYVLTPVDPACSTCTGTPVTYDVCWPPQAVQPPSVNCWDDFQFDDASCTYVNQGVQPVEPSLVNCWDNFVFDSLSCAWNNMGDPSDDVSITGPADQTVCLGDSVTFSALATGSGTLTYQWQQICPDNQWMVYSSTGATSSTYTFLPDLDDADCTYQVIVSSSIGCNAASDIANLTVNVTTCNTDPCLGDVEIIDPSDNCNCIVDIAQVLGCTDATAINFDTAANCDDGSCFYTCPVYSGPAYDNSPICDSGLLNVSFTNVICDPNNSALTLSATLPNGSNFVQPLDCSSGDISFPVSIAHTGLSCGPEIQDIVYQITCDFDNSVIESGIASITVYSSPTLGSDFSQPLSACETAITDNCGYIIQYQVDGGGYSTTVPTQLNEGDADITIDYIVTYPGAPAGCESSGSYNVSCPTILVNGCLDACDPNFDPSANVNDPTLCAGYDASCNTECDLGPFGGTWDPATCSCINELSPVNGCTDASATNFDAAANCEDGSCNYDLFGCLDPCDPNFDPNANVNDSALCAGYDSSCNTDCSLDAFNGSWDPATCSCINEIVPVNGCTDPSANNFNAAANCDDLSCAYEVFGCLDPCSANFDPNADTDDGSCMPYDTTCNTDCNSGPFGGIWDASTCACTNEILPVNGCTDAAACNYNPAANCDDGSCNAIPVCNTDPCLGDIEGIDPADICNCIVITASASGCLDPLADNYNPAANCSDPSLCTYTTPTISIMDPCDCSNPNNIDLDGDGLIDIVADLITIMAPAGDTWTLTSNVAPLALDMFGSPLSDSGTVTMIEVSAGVYEITIYYLPDGSGFGGTSFSSSAGYMDLSIMSSGSPCDCIDCPTYGSAIFSANDLCSGDVLTVTIPGTCSGVAPSDVTITWTIDGLVSSANQACGDAVGTWTFMNSNCISETHLVDWSITCDETGAILSTGGMNVEVYPDDISAFVSVVENGCDVEAVLDPTCVIADWSFTPSQLVSGNIGQIGSFNITATYTQGPACAAPITVNGNYDCSVPGCTDPCAINYSPLADTDDGSCMPYDTSCNTDCTLGDLTIWNPATCGCEVDIVTVSGCIDPLAINYNPAANCDDSSCTYTIPGCTDPCAANYDPVADTDDGSCIMYDTTCNTDCTIGDITIWDLTTCSCEIDIVTISGCIDPLAVNYDPAANCDDASCTYTVPGCTDPCAPNYDPNADTDDGSCQAQLLGCTDPAADNYDPTALCDDGLCSYGCSPGDAGVMPTGIQIACWAETMSVASSGVNTNGLTLAYVMHDGTFTTIYGWSLSGLFTNDGSIPTNIYPEPVISAVVGPAGANGYPDLLDACTTTSSYGTPVRFLTEITIDHTFICNDATGEYTAVFTVIGGYPDYPNGNNAFYTVIGDYAGSVLSGASTTFGPLADGSSYSISVVDDQKGCSATASGTPDCGKTPVTLMSYIGEVLPEGNYLKWLTASEENNDYYTLEVSEDGGSTFRFLGTIDGAGNSSGMSFYDLLHEDAIVGTSYYKLWQTDFDGTKVELGIVALSRSDVFSGMTLSPVPALDFVDIMYDATVEEDVVISLTDIAGKILRAESMTTVKGNNALTIDLTKYESGVFFITIHSKDDILTEKFVKE